MVLSFLIVSKIWCINSELDVYGQWISDLGHQLQSYNVI